MSKKSSSLNEAAASLSDSAKIVRRFAKGGKLKSKKTEAADSVPFTKQELDKLQSKEVSNYEQIATFLQENAMSIVKKAGKNHSVLITKKRWQDVKKNQQNERTLVQLLARYIHDYDLGKPEFEKLSKKIAEDSIDWGLTIEETIDSSMILKKAIWNALEQTSMLNVLPSKKLYELVRRISLYHDTIASQIAFAYHHQFSSAQRELIESERRFARVFKSGPVAFSIKNMSSGKLIDVNEQFTKLVGYKRDEVIGKTSRAYHMDTATNDLELKKDSGNKKSTVRRYSTIKTKKGIEKRLLSTSIVVDTNGEKNEISMHLDVTANYKWENALRVREERYRSLFDSIDDGFCIVELISDNKNKAKDLRFIEANIVFEKSSGIKNPIGKTLSELTGRKYTKWIADFEQVAKSGIQQRMVNYMERTGRWYEVTLTRVGGADSNLVAQFTKDVTEKYTIEKEREQAMKKVINTLESIGEMFLQIDSDWQITMVNNLLEKRVGQSREDLLGKNCWLVLPEYDRPDRLYFQMFHKVMADRKSRHFIEYYEADQDWIEWHVYPADNGISVFARDITAQKLAEENKEKFAQLSVEHDELLQISRAKDEFIGIASHQLRTPATAVKQYLGMMLLGMAGTITDEQRKYLETAYTSNERELNLINDLLKTAQIDASAFALNRSKQNIGQLAFQAVDSIEPTVRRRKQRLVFVDNSEGCEINVDPVEIDLVFSNLLDNASKYSNEKTTITVTINKVHKYIEVSIADQGIGISEEDRNIIYDKFTRITNKSTASVSGSGLGLYWVKHIVEMHGGSVRLESAVGKGSTFILRIPA